MIVCADSDVSIPSRDSHTFKRFEREAYEPLLKRFNSLSGFTYIQTRKASWTWKRTLQVSIPSRDSHTFKPLPFLSRINAALA